MWLNGINLTGPWRGSRETKTLKLLDIRLGTQEVFHTQVVHCEQWSGALVGACRVPRGKGAECPPPQSDRGLENTDAQALLEENSMKLPQKTKNIVAIWSRNPTPGHILRQNYNLKKYMYSSVHSSTIYNSQDMEIAWISIDRWMDKEDVRYIYMYQNIAQPLKRMW